MILSYAMAVNSIAVAKVLQIIGINKDFSKKMQIYLNFVLKSHVIRTNVRT